MHKLGVLIYNNNKGKELLDCIQSVLSSDMDDYASTFHKSYTKFYLPLAGQYI